MGKITIETEVGEVSDGYHTFGELYEHRHALFCALMTTLPELSWKSKLHHDGTMFPDYFIAGINLATGTISYHMPVRLYWDLLSNIETLENAPEWDGHTSRNVVCRLENWVAGYQND